jgi:transposase
MSVHRSVRLGPGGRRRIVEAVEGGMTQKRAAARFCVSPATVNRWVVRARQASPAERAAGKCFEERSCRPRSSPRLLSTADHDRVCELRQRTGWGPRLIASEVSIPHATVHPALRRRGCSRRPRQPREAAQRYEWPCPGNLLRW